MQQIFLSIKPQWKSLFLFVGALLTGINCAPRPSSAQSDTPKEIATTVNAVSSDGKALDEATFGMGCFWHSEEMFSEIKGVTQALPGYAGGTTKHPTYDEVSTGTTGYAESVEVTYDPAKISYDKLLEVFFTEHDPTTPNYSAPDEGPQYRSIIFYHTPEQKQQAEAYIAKLTASHKFRNPIVTQVVPFTKFFQAEDYHLHYYRKNPDQGYIASVTRPEVERFRRDFPSLVK